MKKDYNIAVFDFDGTITKKDTLIDLIIKIFGLREFWTQFIKLLPQAFLYLVGKLHNSVPKQNLFSAFFAGMRTRDFDWICNEYSLNRMSSIIRPECIDRINWHKKRKDKIVIVSASLENWIKPWAYKNGIYDVIATKAAIYDGIIAGGFASPNCYGDEKVKRFLQKYPDRDKYYLYVYGSNKGNKSLFKIADEPFLRRFS